mgnify:CR=1 FL=1
MGPAGSRRTRRGPGRGRHAGARPWRRGCGSCGSRLRRAGHAGPCCRRSGWRTRLCGRRLLRRLCTRPICRWLPGRRRRTRRCGTPGTEPVSGIRPARHGWRLGPRRARCRSRRRGTRFRRCTGVPMGSFARGRRTGLGRRRHDRCLRRFRSGSALRPGRRWRCRARRRWGRGGPCRPGLAPSWLARLDRRTGPLGLFAPRARDIRRGLLRPGLRMRWRARLELPGKLGKPLALRSAGWLRSARGLWRTGRLGGVAGLRCALRLGRSLGLRRGRRLLRRLGLRCGRGWLDTCRRLRSARGPGCGHGRLRRHGRLVGLACRHTLRDIPGLRSVLGLAFPRALGIALVLAHEPQAFTPILLVGRVVLLVLFRVVIHQRCPPLHFLDRCYTDYCQSIGENISN